MTTLFENKSPISDSEITEALNIACSIVKHNLPDYTYNCQNHSSVNGFYPKCENNQWTSGFWPGEVWLSYEHTNEDCFRKTGEILVDSFYDRIINQVEVDHHDMGFLYSPSCVAAYKLTGNEKAKEAALLAADKLVSRFHEVGEFIQAWGDLNAEDNYRYIIDCLLNLPLLYWAYDVTNKSIYKEVCDKHITTCLKYSIREDGSTYHTVFMDRVTGEMTYGRTCQGYKDDSFWARGQAWAVYGTALSYKYTKNEKYLDVFRKVLQFYLDKLPEDLVPYWDMIFTSGDVEPRDSSSSAIVACGLLEMSKYVEKEESEKYIDFAKKMMKSLVTKYSNKDLKTSNGLLLHQTYSKKSPYNTCTPEGVDECCSFGDYFYMEALTRLNCDWEMYW